MCKGETEEHAGMHKKTEAFGTLSILMLTDTQYILVS